MKNVIKPIIRISITIIVSLIIIMFVNGILDIKHSKKNNMGADGWDWQKENRLIFNMLYAKYPDEYEENYMMVMDKNSEIPKKEEDEKRILVIGDSYIWGYGGTNVNYTWWKQLNLKIKEAGYSNVNVYGAGRYFTNTKDQLDKILNNDDLMKSIDPDLVIIGYVPNDPEERDETNKVNLIKVLGDPIPEDNKLYNSNPTLYKEMEQRYYSMEADYQKLKTLGDILGVYRWDLWTLMIVEGENFERYKTVLKNLDNRMKELDIPYFYFFSNFDENPLTYEAETKVYNEVKNMGISAYFHPLTISQMRIKLPQDKEYDRMTVNPGDDHPGIVKNYYYSSYVYDTLMNDYKFIFEDGKMQNIDDLELNINDTMPYLTVKKRGKNIFEFEYPKKEEKRTEESNFLYYPIEKNYIKLNLEYPKNVSKIIVRGKSLVDAEIYVNTIDKEYGYDIKDAKNELTLCKYLGFNNYKVNGKITSVNIAATFNNEEDRTIQIEFIEE